MKKKINSGLKEKIKSMEKVVRVQEKIMIILVVILAILLIKYKFF